MPPIIEAEIHADVIEPLAVTPIRVEEYQVSDLKCRKVPVSITLAPDHDYPGAVFEDLVGSARHCGAIRTRFKTQRHPIPVSGALKVMPEAPYHPHIAGAIQATELCGLRVVYDAVLVMPNHAEIIMEVAPLLAGAVYERTILGRTGDLNVSIVKCGCPLRVLHRDGQHVRSVGKVRR